ncbi:MAG: SDR family oxidoreductase [Bacteroidetes bacterium]|nr:SDR family oxidoreductase [Bacteroidota bacterium]
MNLSPKIAYIAGGSTGIGLSIAMKLARLDYTVCIFARDANKLNHAQASILQAGGTCYAYSVDATDSNGVKQTMAYAVSEAGVPDLLFNCVGRAIPHRFENITGGMLLDTLQANVGSTWHVIQALLPYMKANGGGRIVNTSSMGGLLGVYGYTDYAASKFALIGFSESLRQELKPHNISVQVLCPPDTDTPGLEQENLTKPAETRAISQAAGLMTADQVAAYAIRSMRKDKFMIIPGLDSKLTWILKRVWPEITHRIMDRMVKRVQKQSIPNPTLHPYPHHLARA